VDWLSGFHCEEQKQQLGDRKNTVIGQILSTTIGGKNGEPKQVSWVIMQVGFYFPFSAVEWDDSFVVDFGQNWWLVDGLGKHTLGHMLTYNDASIFI
jgi:hypothetical protein